MMLAIHMYIPGISVYFLDKNSLGHIYFNVLFICSHDIVTVFFIISKIQRIVRGINNFGQDMREVVLSSAQ